MDFVKQHIALLVAAFLLWFGYGELNSEQAAEAKKKKLEGIGPRYLAVRPQDQERRVLEDPYRFTSIEAEQQQDASTGAASLDEEEGMTPYASNSPHAGGAETVDPRGPNPNGGAGSVSTQGADTSGAGLGRAVPPAQGAGHAGSAPGQQAGEAAATSARRPEIVGAESGETLLHASRTENGEELPPMLVPIDLWVDALLETSTGGSARICNELVRLGEEVPFVDVAAPPVLRSVSGMTASVRYRGNTYVLGLDEVRLTIHPPLPDVAIDQSWYDDLFPELW